MNKFDPTLEEKLLSLVIYLLFKQPDGLDAFCLADLLGMNSKESDDFYNETEDPNEPLKDWIRLGGKVNFSWLENHGPLEFLTMGQYQYEILRGKDPILYEKIKLIRDKSNKRWSNDWKQIHSKILTAKSLIKIKPNYESLDLTWRSMVSSCARKLQQINKQDEAMKIQELSFKDQLIAKKLA